MRHAAFALAAILAVAPAVHAQTVTIRSAKDATVRGGSYASKNFGDDPILVTRASNSDRTYLRRAAMMFDTDARVPANAHIASATLVLTVKGGNSESRRLGACSIPVSFDEWSVTWKLRRTGSAWQNPGVDVVDGSCSSAPVTATPRSQVRFNVTAQVQKVINGVYGSRFARFLVGDLGADSKGSLKAYYSNNDPNTALRPTLIVTIGTSTTAPDPAPTTATGTTLRVLHWNTHHGGVGTDGKYDPNRLATWIAKFKPDVISLNEIEYFTGYGNEDQPARFASMLKAKTGRRWYYKFVTANGATRGNGNLVMSRFPLDSKAAYHMSYDRAAAEITFYVNGRAIHMISTHLDADSTSRRLSQIGQLKSWASGIAEQRIIAGDFNAWPQTSENAKMVTTYYDSWAQAVKKNLDVSYAGNPDGNTRNTRIDYIYYSHGASALVLRKVQVFDTRSGGVMPSDHRPVMATFTVR
jgi:endonuclease/exonuclease/phosphatase family metal-dependent hydrolase